MSARRIATLAFVALACASLPPASAGTKPAKAPKYEIVTIEPFTVQQGVDFPIDWLATLQEEVTQQMTQAKVFRETLRSGEKPSQPSPSQLTLTGVVTEFKAGSRTKRYMLGPIAGKTRIVAHIKFTEPETGKVVFENDVKGSISGGFIGGESINATRGLGKAIAGVAKKKL
jgi:hypothetical protein